MDIIKVLKKKRDKKKKVSSNLNENDTLTVLHKTLDSSANDASVHKQSKASADRQNNEVEEDEEFIKNVQRHVEIHKRELKYELLLDLRSKLGK